MAHQLIDILLIEDNPDDAILAIHELKKVSMMNNLVHVMDGEEALDFIFLKENFPRLILLDLNMPGLSGVEVLEKLKRDERSANIPVVILTGSREDPEIKKCFNLGASSYIAKPVTYAGFIQAVKHLGLSFK